MIGKEVRQGLDSPGELLVVSLETWSSRNGISGLFDLDKHNDENKIKESKVVCKRKNYMTIRVP